MPTPHRRILHLTDASTPVDSFDMLAAILRGADAPTEHRLFALGHRSTQLLAEHAAITQPIEWLPSVGWADPTGWRALRRIVTQWQPTHIHAWGFPAIVATAFSGSPAMRIATFTNPPTRGQLRMLRWLEMRAAPWRWVASSATIQKTLLEFPLKTENVTCIRPAVGGSMPLNRAEVATLRNELEIDPSDGPILLLGGEGPAARHDFGLWAAAIFQQLFPRTRVIVREDPRGCPDSGLDRFLNALPEEHIIAVARPELPFRQLLSIADAFLLTPDHGCGTGSLLHAMAAGVPVVGTPVPCMAEIIQDGENGLLAESVAPRAIAAKLELLLNDATMQNALSARARVRVESSFPTSRLLEEYARIHADSETPTNAAIAAT
ncbi:MAG TPA: glycosyltransferase family 4 protein [Phycisphaerae bacterium]|nr:glycosyltransferase family 4 protein [Phycisphaerae bacterium]